MALRQRRATRRTKVLPSPSLPPPLHTKSMETSKVSLKLLVNKRTNKVLFAEVGKDFVDFLISLFSLPIGTVVRLLSKESMVGCLGTLYGSIENLDDTYIQPNQHKDSFLKPKTQSSVTIPLMLQEKNTTSTSARVFYTCCNRHSYVADTKGVTCPSCVGGSSRGTTFGASPFSTVTVGGVSSFVYLSGNSVMNAELHYVGSTTVNKEASSSNGEGGYVKGVMTYMVTDDLAISPMSTISSIALLNTFNVELDALEQRAVSLSMEEGLKLLKASLQSKAVLTSVFLEP